MSTLRLSISGPGLACIQTSTVSASPCGYAFRIPALFPLPAQLLLITAATTPTTKLRPDNPSPCISLLCRRGLGQPVHTIALAEGCKNEPQHAGISVCTCRKLPKRTAARKYKCMHLRVRSSPVPGGVHLQKAAKTNRGTQV